MQTETRIETTSGSTYLRKLCRHFAHKVPATVSDDQGIIEFHFGRCRIKVAQDHLHCCVDVENEQQFTAAEQVITEHLTRMARSEALSVQWVRHV